VSDDWPYGAGRRCFDLASVVKPPVDAERTSAPGLDVPIGNFGIDITGVAGGNAAAAVACVDAAGLDAM